MEEQLGKYNYVVECLKSDKTPKYLIVNSPLKSQTLQRRGSTGVQKLRASAINMTVSQKTKTKVIVEDKKLQSFHFGSKPKIPTDKNKSKYF